MMEMVVTTGTITLAKLLQSNRHHKPTPSFLQARCPCCRPANSVKALNCVVYTTMCINNGACHFYFYDNFGKGKCG